MANCPRMQNCCAKQARGECCAFMRVRLLRRLQLADVTFTYQTAGMLQHWSQVRAAPLVLPRMRQLHWLRC